jgi:transcriptional regulator GlxA family with amidase domain
MPIDRRRVGILVSPEVEVLDFCGPFEVLSTTRLNEDRRREEPSPYEVILVSDHDLDGCPTLGVLVVPGGWGTRKEMRNERLVAWIAERSRRVETLASVCTGSLLLAKAGLLDGRRATTYWKVLDEMRGLFPAIAVVDDEHVVEDGDVLASAGISAGIDLALRVVARHLGEVVARATTRHMEYPCPEDDGRRV